LLKDRAVAGQNGYHGLGSATLILEGFELLLTVCCLLGLNSLRLRQMELEGDLVL